MHGSISDFVSTPPPPPLVKTKPRNVRELPADHAYQLSFHLPDDFVVYGVPGDGSCFFGAVAAHIYRDETQVSCIIRLCHFNLVENWEYYKLFIEFPFMEKVGVGASSYRVCFDIEEDLKEFFLSEESLKCFSSSQLDYALVCNMFNITIGVFTYGNIFNEEPRLTFITPDSFMAQQSPFYDPSIKDMFLYHADNSHYDLLVPRNSTLAINGNISSMYNNNNDEIDDEEVFEEEIVYNDNPFKEPAAAMSPLVFKPCPKGPGRPKMKRNGMPVLKEKNRGKKRTHDEDVHEKVVEEAPKKKRGRPAGSKNKPKVEEKPKKNHRDRAEKAADVENEESFMDSVDICAICEFEMNHPMKIDKPRGRCPRCA